MAHTWCFFSRGRQQFASHTCLYMLSSRTLYFSRGPYQLPTLLNDIYIDIVQTSNNVRCRYDIGSCIKHGSRDDAHLINRIQWSESSVTSMASSEERGDLLVLRIDLYYEHVCLMILNGYELQSLVIIIHSYINAVLPS